MMQTVGTILIIIGIFYFLMMILRPPFVYNTKKVRVMIKMMGKRGFDIFFFLWATVVLVAGILLAK